MGIPCLTYRTSTERPVTASEGTNILTMDKDSIVTTVKKIMLGIFKDHTVPKMWDGSAGSRIALLLKRELLLV